MLLRLNGYFYSVPPGGKTEDSDEEEGNGKNQGNQLPRRIFLDGEGSIGIDEQRSGPVAQAVAG